MITKRKKPAPLPVQGLTVRDRRPAVAPKRGVSKRRRTALRRDLGRGRGGPSPATLGVFETVWHSVLAFGGAALLVSCVASLAGNVMLEASRRGTIEARQRLRAESAGREDLKGKLAALASNDAVDRWATEHGYVGADQAPVLPRASGDRGLVARR